MHLNESLVRAIAQEAVQVVQQHVQEHKQDQSYIHQSVLAEEIENLIQANAARFAALFRASKEGDGSKVQQLLEEGCPVMATDQFGRTPLHWSCRNGHVDLVKILLAQQVSLDIRDNCKKTALELAVRHKEAPCIEVLLDHEPGGGCSLTVLTDLAYKLATFGKLQPLSHLIKSFSTDGATTPLHVAAASGNMKAALCISAVGSSLLRIKDERGRTPVEVAASCRRPKLVRFLSLAPNYLLHQAAIQGNADIVWFLLQHGASIDEKDDTGATPLHYASQYGRTEVVYELCMGKAAINTPYPDDDDNYRPLHLAAKAGNEAVINALLLNGEDITVKTNLKRRTALHIACMHGNVRAVRYLLEEGCNIDAQDRDGMSALHHAAREGRLRSAKLLLHYNADTEIKDSCGRTAADQANGCSHQKAIMCCHKKVTYAIESHEWGIA
jgi:ankyrin repeat protein